MYFVLSVKMSVMLIFVVISSIIFVLDSYCVLQKFEYTCSALLNTPVHPAAIDSAGKCSGAEMNARIVVDPMHKMDMMENVEYKLL